MWATFTKLCARAIKNFMYQFPCAAFPNVLFNGHVTLFSRLKLLRYSTNWMQLCWSNRLTDFRLNHAVYLWNVVCTIFKDTVGEPRRVTVMSSPVHAIYPMCKPECMHKHTHIMINYILVLPYCQLCVTLLRGYIQPYTSHEHLAISLTRGPVKSRLLLSQSTFGLTFLLHYVIDVHISG